jgi:DNA-binding transcriptional LysR family regulator
MNLRNLDLNLLAVFDAILTEGNLTRAAERLAMSQPAVSNALARLRATLDDPLFTRSAHGMTPTPRARLLAGPIGQALDLIQNSVSHSSTFDYTSSARRFVIAVEDYGEAVIIPRFVDWLCQVAPNLRINVCPMAGNLLREAVLKGDVDLGVSYFRIKGPEFRNRLLMEESLVSMVRLDHPLVGETLSLEQYLQLSHVILMPRTTDKPIIDRVLGKMGVSRRIILQVPHMLSMPLVVRSTDLVCTIMRRMANLYADLFRLRILKTPVDCPEIPIYLSWHQSLDAESEHTWLRESIWELCQRV